jgi:hypothetical protein
MKVHDFGGTHRVHSIAQLEQLLGARFKYQMNEFSLCPDSGVYPLIKINVRGDLAAIYYYRGDEQAGYVSLGGKMNLDPKGETSFSIDNRDPGETIDVLNEFIVPFSEALDVAKEFFHSQELPRSIKWLEL